jgi:hypothetical protein
MELEALEAEILNLPLADRTHLLDRLVMSLEADTAIEQAWVKEASRRDAEIESGLRQTVDGQEVIARLMKKYA